MKILISCFFIIVISLIQVASTNAQNLSNSEMKQIESATGIQGEASDGEYKITIPQNDLNVKTDGFDIIPPMGMGSWVAFKKATDGIVVMGDIVLKEDEIKPVQQVLVDNGLTVTGLHNHFVREEPLVMYMHIGGSGELEEISASVKKVIDKIEELRGADPASASPNSVKNAIDTDAIVKSSDIKEAWIAESTKLPLEDQMLT